MLRPKISHFLGLGGFIFLFITPLVFAETPRGTPSTIEVLEEKTLNRWPDPVVADCGLFTSLAGKEIKSLRVYTHSQGSFHPIPFQIDEKDAQGHRVYPAGEKANPQDGNGLIDKGEELVFMARDCGDRISQSIFPSLATIWQGC